MALELHPRRSDNTTKTIFVFLYQSLHVWWNSEDGKNGVSLVWVRLSSNRETFAIQEIITEMAIVAKAHSVIPINNFGDLCLSHFPEDKACSNTVPAFCLYWAVHGWIPVL